MTGMRWRKKRYALILLIVCLLVLFYNSEWMQQILYPVEYKAYIRQSATNHQVDPLLIAAVIRVESNFRPDRRSSKGAIGLMQIMPETGTWIFERAGYPLYTVESLERADINIEIGAWYLNYLQKQFNGQLVQAVAAYNAGQGNVSRWMSSGIWDGRRETAGQIPFPETRQYVQRVLYYYYKYDSIYRDDFE